MVLSTASPTAAQSDGAQKESAPEPLVAPTLVLAAVASGASATAAFVGTLAWGAVLGAVVAPDLPGKPYLLQPSPTPNPEQRRITELASHAALGVMLATPVALGMALMADGLTWSLVNARRGAFGVRVLMAYGFALLVCVPVAAVIATSTAGLILSLSWERDRFATDTERAGMTAWLAAAVAMVGVFPMLSLMAGVLRVSASGALLPGAQPSE
ncbi:MAG: hypothetical protein AB2A00_40050 [Myxococcota bacterium]